MAFNPSIGRVIRRFALTANASVNAAASQNAQALSGPSIFLPVIDPTQALRLISCFSRVADAGGTHFLTMLGARVQVAMSNFLTQTANMFSVRSFTPLYGPLLLGQTGAAWEVTDDEYIYGTDYQEFLTATGAQAGSFNLQIAADVTNSDAAIHPVTFVITALVEIYQRVTPQ